MVKPEIKQRIIEVANILVSEGVEEPTNAQVRERLGGGSLSHISPVMREWRNDRKNVVAVAINMPTELKNSIEISLTQIWSVATKIASKDLENYKNESTMMVDSISLERDEAFNEIQRLENHIRTLEAESIEKEELLSIVKKDNDELLKQFKNAVNEKQSLNMILEDRKNQITELNKNIKDLQSELIALAKKK